MKIAFILPGIGRSGGIRNTVVAANHLLARGHKVRILYHKGPLSVRSMLRSMRNKLVYPGRHNWLGMFEGDSIGFRDITSCEFASDEIIAGVGVWSSAELAGLSFIHNPKLQYLRSTIPEPVCTQETTESALSSDIPKVVVSSYVGEHVRSYRSGDVLGVIPNGIKVEEYYPDNVGNARNGVGIIYGRSYAKDPNTILAVLRRLREDLPDIPQYIFGQGRPPGGIPTRDYIRFPSVQKARRIYSRCKVWILASRSEGFGMPILEAMACGCAVVATDCGGPRDIINDGENGFLVQVGNVKQIVSKVKLLLDGAELRRQFTRNSKDTVSKFSWENSVDKLEKVLFSLDKAEIR